MNQGAKVKRERLREVAESCRRGGRELDLSVGLIMTAKPPCTSATTPINRMPFEFDRFDTDHLFVVDEDGELMGVVTPRDLLSLAARLDDPAAGEHPRRAAETAADLTGESLVSVEPSTSLRRALKLMADFHIACLPVCSRDIPIGILTGADLHLFTEELLLDLPTAQTI